MTSLTQIKSKSETLPIVIIGAGTVGLLLAHELMLGGHKIIVIEAGGDNIRSFSSNEYDNIGHEHHGIAFGRTKGFGGTSNLWGGQFTEFISSDFEIKGTFDQPEWLIEWKEIRHYYEQVYKKFGFKATWNGEGEKLTETPQNDDLELYYTRWLKQPNFKTHFLNDLRTSDLVTILDNTSVTNLLFTNNTCTAIEIYSNGRKSQIENCENVILANGTIEICRLLLVAAQFKNCPFAKNKWIGKYFQDHLNFGAGQITQPAKKLFHQFSNIIRHGEKLQPKIRLNNIQSNDDYLGISGFFAFNNKVSQHLDNFKQFSKAVLGRSQQKVEFKNMLKLFISSVKAAPQIALIIYNYLKNNRIYVPFKSSISFCLQVQQISIESSQITLSAKDSDQNGMPRAILNWQIDGREFSKIYEFCMNVKAYLSANNLGSLQLEKWLEQEKNNPTGNWFKHIGDMYHMAGGTIMGHSYEDSVVDTNLKVHHTNNVFVCGASVMPTSSYANTTFTALALTMKLANYFKKKT